MIAGDDPQILVLAYYILKLSTDHEVTIGYTCENKLRRDDVAGIESPYSERHLTALGCKFEELRNVDPRQYDMKIDFLTYKVEGLEKGDYVTSIGPIEIRIAEKKGVPIYVEDSEDVDSDVLKYLKQRVDLKRKYRPIRIIYGIDHLVDPDIVIGYGSTSTFGGVCSLFKDPFCIYRHCIYTSILLITGRHENIRNFPSWINIKLRELHIVRYGPSSSDILKRSITPTIVTFTVGDTYLKLISTYRRPPIAFQCVGPSFEVIEKTPLLYGIVSVSIESSLARLLAFPSVIVNGSRSWIDSVTEMLVRECYWLVHM